MDNGMTCLQLLDRQMLTELRPGSMRLSWGGANFGFSEGEEGECRCGVSENARGLVSRTRRAARQRRWATYTARHKLR